MNVIQAEDIAKNNPGNNSGHFRQVDFDYETILAFLLNGFIGLKSPYFTQLAVALGFAEN